MTQQIGNPLETENISKLLVSFCIPSLLILLPKGMGLSGILWAGPVADLAMAVTAGGLFVRELQKLERQGQ